MAETIDTRSQIRRQVNHWREASIRLSNLDNLASLKSWDNLETYMGISIRNTLLEATNRLKIQGEILQLQMNRVNSEKDTQELRNKLIEYRNQYLQTETTLHFFTDAINTRTNDYIASFLRACDIISQKSLLELLDKFTLPTPPILTYVDKGLGASILKAGLRLWDSNTISPVAAIKVTYHNLFRPTSIQHEAGHQMAHMLKWNSELAKTLYNGLKDDNFQIAEVWSNWSSEIAADAFAFVHSGYASVAALHDVLAGSEYFVFAYNPNDPHPISFLRVLMNIQMCKEFYGNGPWDDLEYEWKSAYNNKNYAITDTSIIEKSIPLIPKIVKLILSTPQTCFRGHSLSGLIDPWKVSPNALIKFELENKHKFNNSSFVYTECLRILALNGFRTATQSNLFSENTKIQESFMLNLGKK